MKTKEVVQVEESLREFFIDEYTMDARERENNNLYKYRGLTITVNNLVKEALPQFSVQIALLEATFAIDSGKKLEGGLPAGDERMIQKWLSRGANRSLLKMIWNGVSVDKQVKLQPFDLF